MTTPQSNASGFSGDGNVAVNACWPRPGQKSTGQNISGRILVSVEDQFAMWAAMCAYGKILFDLSATIAAHLTGSSRIYFHHLCTGTFSLVFQGRQESAPGGIGNRSAHPVAPEHLGDVQALHCDQAVATAQIKG